MSRQICIPLTGDDRCGRCRDAGRYCFPWCFPSVSQPGRRLFKCLRCVIVSQHCTLKDGVEWYARNRGLSLQDLAAGGRILAPKRAPDADAWYGGSFPGDKIAPVDAVAAAVSATPAAKSSYVPRGALDPTVQDMVDRLPEVEPRKRPAKAKDKERAMATPMRSQPGGTVVAGLAKTAAPPPIVDLSRVEEEAEQSQGVGDDGGGDGGRPQSARISPAPSGVQREAKLPAAQPSRHSVPDCMSFAKFVGPLTRTSSSRWPSRGRGRSKESGCEAEVEEEVDDSGTPARLALDGAGANLSPRAMSTVSAEPPGPVRDHLIGVEMQRHERTHITAGNRLSHALQELAVSGILVSYLLLHFFDTHLQYWSNEAILARDREEQARRTMSALRAARGGRDDDVDPLHIFRAYFHPDAEPGSSEWTRLGRARKEENTRLELGGCTKEGEKNGGSAEEDEEKEKERGRGRGGRQGKERGRGRRGQSSPKT